jgi:hypothetical protein
MKYVYLATAHTKDNVRGEYQRVFVCPRKALEWLRGHESSEVSLQPPACCDHHIFDTLERTGKADIWEWPDDPAFLFSLERMEVDHSVSDELPSTLGRCPEHDLCEACKDKINEN